jgi:hypothetical protein
MSAENLWSFFIKSAIGTTPISRIVNYFLMQVIEYIDPQNNLSHLNTIGKIQDGPQNGAQNLKNLILAAKWPISNGVQKTFLRFVFPTSFYKTPLSWKI